MITSQKIEASSGKAKVSIQVDLLDGAFAGVSFGVMIYDGIFQDGYVSFTPYGLEQHSGVLHWGFYFNFTFSPYVALLSSSRISWSLLDACCDQNSLMF